MLVDYLVNVARPFIFSTAPAPPVVAAAARRWSCSSRAHTGSSGCRRTRARCARRCSPRDCAVGESETQILPVIVGDPELTVLLCERALERGVFAQGIRPPTVPEGTSRLRLTTMATHRTAELLRAAKVIGNAAHELGLLRRAGAAPRAAKRRERSRRAQSSRRGSRGRLRDA